MSQNVKHLSTEQLGNLVKLIEDKCPQAFKENDEDVCHIFVDNIPKTVFKDVSEYVETCVGADVVTKKVKRR